MCKEPRFRMSELALRQSLGAALTALQSSLFADFPLTAFGVLPRLESLQRRRLLYGEKADQQAQAPRASLDGATLSALLAPEWPCMASWFGDAAATPKLLVDYLCRALWTAWMPFISPAAPTHSAGPSLTAPPLLHDAGGDTRVDKVAASWATWQNGRQDGVAVLTALGPEGIYTVLRLRVTAGTTYSLPPPLP